MDAMNEAVIVSAARTPTGKAKKGSLACARPEELGAAAVREVLRRVPGLDPAAVDDVVFGCAYPEGEQGMNISRWIALAAGLPVSVSAETINRFCSSGLQSVAHAAFAIVAGQLETAVAGGVESMTLVPMTGVEFSPPPRLAVEMPRALITMGLTAENVAAKYVISREDQDAFALESHRRAVRAQDAGYFIEEIVPFSGVAVRAVNGTPEKVPYTLAQDEGPRRDAAIAGLAKLRPAFKEGGTVTAGNASQMSDGAAAVLLTSRRRAKELGLKPLARFVSFATAGVPPEIMGIGPVEAIPKALRLAGLSLKDIALIELNEAFAAQSLAVMRTLDLDPQIVNVNGGAIALGHPLGATGTKLLVHLLYEMRRRSVQFGLVSMCVGGGMGAAGIFENLG